MESNLLFESAYESLVELEAKQKEMEEKHNQVNFVILKYPKLTTVVWERESLWERRLRQTRPNKVGCFSR